MAAKTSSFGKPLIIKQSSARPPIIKVAAPRPLLSRTKKAGRHIASFAAQTAREEKHRIYAVGAAALLGYAEKHKWNLPKIDALGTAGSWGLGGWLALKSGMIRSKTLSHMVTGFLAVAAYQFTSSPSMSGVMIGGR